LAVGVFSPRGFNLALFASLAVGGAAWIAMTPVAHRGRPIALYPVYAAAGQQPGASPASGFAGAPDPAIQPASLEALSASGLGQPLTPQEAMLENAAVPFSGRALSASPSFIMTTSDQALGQTSLNCLAQAVYYEAATEPLEGQRAVAQVVLNRLRNPIFPKTVCGVVYQGSNRPTGCQFTFTCDGSLARTPNPHLWDRAQAVAAQALDGYVQAAVGNATNYHADYVAPAWRTSLVKLTQIGQHIFYSMTGARTVDAAVLQEAGMGDIPPVSAAALLPQSPVAASAPPPAPLVSLQPTRARAAPARDARGILRRRPQSRPRCGGCRFAGRSATELFATARD
jgi:spore germination cell wall hydrolase CwlJ-like protein